MKKNKIMNNGRKPVYSSKDLEKAFKVLAKHYRTNIKTIKTDYKKFKKIRKSKQLSSKTFFNKQRYNKIKPINLKKNAKELQEYMKMNYKDFIQYSSKYQRFYNKKDYENLGKVVKRALYKTPESYLGQFNKWLNKSELELGIMVSLWENTHNKQVEELPYLENESLDFEEELLTGDFTLREANTNKMINVLEKLEKENKNEIKEFKKLFE